MKISSRTTHKFTELEEGFIRRFDPLIKPVRFVIPEVPVRSERRSLSDPELGKIAVSLLEDKTEQQHKRILALEKLVKPLGQNTVPTYVVSLDGSRYAEMAPEIEIDWADPTLKDEDVFSNRRPLTPDDFQFADRLFDLFERGEIVRAIDESADQGPTLA